jgi:hypothetical protein
MTETEKVSDRLGLTTQEDFINLTVGLNDCVYTENPANLNAEVWQYINISV